MKDNNHKRPTTKDTTLVCPVCGRKISGEYLPNIKGVITHNLYYTGGVKIINSVLTLECTFDHFFDEKEGIPLEEPHTVIASVAATFDKTGNCTVFSIKSIKK